MDGVKNGIVRFGSVVCFLEGDFVINDGGKGIIVCGFERGSFDFDSDIIVEVEWICCVLGEYGF